MAHRVFLLLLALVAAGCAVDGSRGVRVVLVTLDTLRRDALSDMPLLLARAESGTSFERFYSATSTTQPSHATLFTGLHPWEHGVTRNGVVLDARFETVAEALQRVGFDTSAVVASYPLAAEFGFGQGFRAFRGEFTTGVGRARFWEGHPLPTAHFFSGAETVTDQALEALAAAKGKRQFHWFHYFDPHAPYGSSFGGDLMESDAFRRVEGGEPEGDVVREVHDLYRRDVAYLDRELERLLSRLAEEADHVDTHVVLVSDHGESLGEGGSLGHGYRLHDVEIHVPALIFSPAVAPGVRRDLAGSIDVAPTLLALAGVEQALPGGRDLSQPARAGIAVGMRRTFRAAHPGERRLDGSVRPLSEMLFYAVDEEGRLRLGNGRGLRGAPQGYDARIRERFVEFERILAAHAGSGELDPAVEERLRALGYAP